MKIKKPKSQPDFDEKKLSACTFKRLLTLVRLATYPLQLPNSSDSTCSCFTGDGKYHRCARKEKREIDFPDSLSLLFCMEYSQYLLGFQFPGFGKDYLGGCTDFTDHLWFGGVFNEY